MLHIQSFVRSPSGLVPVEQYDGPVPDPEYVEGSIELVVRGTPILVRDEADLVDQLWAYLADVAEKVTRGKPASTYFPDQPIKLEMQPGRGRTIDLRVSYGDVDRRAAIDADALVRALCDAGRVYWTRHMVFSPVSAARAMRELARLDALQRAIRS